MNIDSIIHGKRSWINAGMIGVVALCLAISVAPTFRLLQQAWSLSGKIKEHVPYREMPDVSKWETPELSKVELDKQTFGALAKVVDRYRVTIENAQAPILFTDQGYETATQKIVLLGEFVPLLKCLDEVGRDLSFIKIASIEFNREERNKSLVLTANVYFQSAKPEEHEAK
ncbi:hypothetical protein [Chryseolinea soli]|uniref:Type 4a pilus biogenesis protein PilO n=1 Tax=Chryseolinea soli TaxID=2321403 RepID=A0A385SC45_9BACT|nr:hypothetical protein [Chryseolinea soli]AYB29203.1 hypothetical protein D4L85_00770 [Chryseolinea soli]